MKNNRLLIYCAGGLGMDVLRNARRISAEQNRWDDILFVDDGCKEKEIFKAPILSFEEYLQQRQDGDAFVIATGETVFRQRLYTKLKEHGCDLATLVNPTVYLDEFDRLGEGCVISEGTVLGGYLTMGKCSYVNLGCMIGHTTILGDYVTLSPGAIVSGNVTIGDGTYVGTGAVIRDEVTIGKNCIIGMGSLVTKDIPDNSVAYGSPCRVVRENTDGIVFK